MRSGIIVLALAFLAACSSQGSKTGGAAGGDTVAKIGSTVVTAAELQAEIQSLPPQWQTRAKTPHGKKEILDNIVKRRLLMMEADSRGIPQRPEVKMQIEKATSSQILRVLMKEETEQSGAVEEKDLREYFEKHKDRFEQQEQVRARHVLVKLAPNATADEDAKAKKKAEAIRRKLTTANFEEVARKESDGPSAPRGGDLGYFDRKKMDPKFTEVAFGLKLNEISQPVKTSFGYHIIQVTEKKEAKPANFDEMKDQIQRQIEPQLRAERFEKFVSGLRDKFPVEIVDPEIKDSEKAAAEQPAGAAPVPAQSPAPAPVPVPTPPAGGQ